MKVFSIWDAADATHSLISQVKKKKSIKKKKSSVCSKQS